MFINGPFFNVSGKCILVEETVPITKGVLGALGLTISLYGMLTFKSAWWSC